MNTVSDGAEVTSGGKSFQIRAPAIGKALISTVDRQYAGTVSWSVDADPSLRRVETSATRVDMTSTDDELIDEKTTDAAIYTHDVCQKSPSNICLLVVMSAPRH